MARRRWRQLSAMAIRRPPSMSRIPLGKPRPSPRHSAAPLASSMRQTVPLLRRSSRSRCHSSGAVPGRALAGVEDVGPGEAERRRADERLAAQHRQGFSVMGATDDGDAAAAEADREPPVAGAGQGRDAIVEAQDALRPCLPVPDIGDDEDLLAAAEQQVIVLPNEVVGRRRAGEKPRLVEGLVGTQRGRAGAREDRKRHGRTPITADARRRQQLPRQGTAATGLRHRFARHPTGFALGG